jgi:glycerol-3-phosphate cytidylyltransferase
MLKEIFNLKNQGKKIGFTCSTFDLLHAGHIAMLAEAKSKCDYLVVGILTDPTISRKEKNKPIQTMFERFLQLQAVEYIDCIIPFESEEDLEDMLLVLLPDIRIVGEEYENKEHTGKSIEGIKNFYNKRRHHFSSTDIRNRLKKQLK